ncbi:MAG TPA: pyrroline-5-carboxylate reductase [Gemmataceae bacterium]|nr:pyrroline-5-carboxylate reductase [Gemmataceae bacterium]
MIRIYGRNDNRFMNSRQMKEGRLMSGANDFRVGFLGAGKMATALAKGWISAGFLSPNQILAGDPMPQSRHEFAAETKGRVTADNREVVSGSDVLVLAVKPQTMPALLNDIQPVVASRHLVISVAAGINLQTLSAGLGKACRLIRVMPNTGCLVGASASAYTTGENATAEDIALVERLLKAVGIAFRLPEHLLDAVTGLSGSGPAFVFVMIEALSDGGVRVGLPRDVAMALAAQTVFGAAKMVLETGSHPGVLKDLVASPGGTTIAGLHALEQRSVRAALIDAVEAAAKRSAELGKSGISFTI